MNRKSLLITIVLSIFAISISACSVFGTQSPEGNITASGTISAESINISPEVSGKVMEIAAQSGQTVSSGDLLFRIDDQILQAQYKQAQAAVDMASASINAAEQQLNAAKLQASRAEQGARLLALQNQQILVTTWSQGVPDSFEQPYWYYQKDEAIAAASFEVDQAKTLVDTERANLEDVQAKASNDDFLKLEQDLANTRARFLIADQTLNQTKLAQDSDILQEMAQKEYDSALADLENYQRKYDQILTSTTAEEILEARAKLAVAEARLQNAKTQLDMMLTGEDSLDVQAANAVVKSAQAQVLQAQAGKAQAESALELLQIQLNKSMVTAPDNGTILTDQLQIGELIGAGSIAMTIAKLDVVSLTVYVPEDVYGRIEIDQKVNISVDSYPNKVFSGTVIRIADQAEFTPRNVQTVEGRKSTVYAVEVRIPNSGYELKPGMPADVDFGIVR
ncbi:MAG: HlyD family secretion protein [Anaerolineaceae bacterium]